MQHYTVVDPASFDPVSSARRAFAEHVLVGLSERPKRLSSRFIYDAVGSELFQQITELDEYYPTACEFAIFRQYGSELLARFAGRPLNLIDLGAGDGRKTAVLLEAAQQLGLDVQYVPLDISEDAIAGVVKSMGTRFPDLPIHGVVAEYSDGVRWLGEQSGRCNLVLFLGSNIGNFDKASGRAFLRKLWSALRDGDHVLVGFDLKKDIEVLLAAYNDREGVTAQFNLNLLARINRELGANFAVDDFRHFATYDVFSGAMESYLVSKVEQEVSIDALGTRFRFQPWEPIHTEYSYKYLQSDIDKMGAFAGFASAGQWHDDRGWFTDVLWRVAK